MAFERQPVLAWYFGMKLPMPLVNLAQVRAGRQASTVARAVLAGLAIIQDRLIGYFHVGAGNLATDTEADRLEVAARNLRDA